MITSYTLQDLAEDVVEGPAVAVFPDTTPQDAMRRFFDNYDDVSYKDAFADIIVVSCDSDQEASELSKQLESAFIQHLQLKEE